MIRELVSGDRGHCLSVSTDCRLTDAPKSEYIFLTEFIITVPVLRDEPESTT